MTDYRTDQESRAEFYRVASEHSGAIRALLDGAIEMIQVGSLEAAERLVEMASKRQEAQLADMVRMNAEREAVRS